ncbi:hypothetical protein F0562_004614 [Nyssa sinensis]|uniref:Uncharacterized protein n=1 Tax=Nyssa sinensis TaxID=561372 RepID=A0A5J5BYF3_9ASTE|nr:hypothetical protein F0562_004614 [Nyssa sinensis]
MGDQPECNSWTGFRQGSNQFVSPSVRRLFVSPRLSSLHSWFTSSATPAISPTPDGTCFYQYFTHIQNFKDVAD